MAKSRTKTLAAQAKRKAVRISRETGQYIARQRAAVFAAFYSSCPVDPKMVLYESFYGRGMLCNPNGLFHSFMRRPDFHEYVHVWVIEDFHTNAAIIEEYRTCDNVVFVEFLSEDYFRYLATAGYLVNNVMFPSYFVKKEEQVYINTWHGIPLKTLGYDQVDGNSAAANTVRNFLSADYLISPCTYFTDVYKNAFKLEGIYNGKIIEEGQPRNDLTIHADKQEILERMKRNGVEIEDGKKIILYAPTWKGQSYGNPTVNSKEYLDFIDYIESRVDTTRYQVLVKPHQVVYQYMKAETADIGKFVPAVLDANEVLAVTDILISDYSSIYFDFMVTGRPILFYVPDLESYQDYRGLYLGLDQLPGPVTQQLEEVGDWLQDLEKVEEENRERYQAQRDRFVYLDDGESADRVWEVVLDGSPDHHVIDTLLNHKQRLLLYIGVTRVNGITETFGSLLNMMDYGKFDVSVIAIDSDNPYEHEKLEKINSKARVLMRAGGHCMTVEEAVRNEIMVEQGISPETMPYYDPAFYEREWRRHVGNSTFDYVINYTGYSPVYAFMMMQAKGARKIVWQHNDLKQDMEKVVNGKKVNRKVLQAMFTTYPYHDRIVACSRSVMETNRENLATRETYGKFTYCKNTLSFERVIEGMKKADVVEYGGARYYVKKSIAGAKPETALLEMVPLPREEEISFVTIGRLSPEKNHINLIHAFCRFHEKYRNAKLYIMGDGLLGEELQMLITRRGALDYVKLLGNVSNPFGIMKECDCFILPSYFEGQPIVLLEARTVGLPIIVADFSTVKDSLIPDGQLQIGHTEDDIYEGLKAFCEGNVPCKKFDPLAYNREAYEEFEAAILGGS